MSKDNEMTLGDLLEALDVRSSGDEDAVTYRIGRLTLARRLVVNTRAGPLAVVDYDLDDAGVLWLEVGQ